MITLVYCKRVSVRNNLLHSEAKAMSLVAHEFYTQVYQSMSSQTVCLIDGWMTALKELIISLIHLVDCLLLSTLGIT